MLNKLAAFVTRYGMLESGDRVVCAVSGGADSVALLFAMYLLREKLQITVEAAHFNHCLRAAESDRDEAFVKALCDRYDIPLHTKKQQVIPGEKGLEAAAREARYSFLRSLEGKVATAHTADDNAETVLMHMVRGTGLRGLGGIAPVRGKLIRPMLEITRQEVTAFLEEYHISWVEDSSNAADDFFRNRLRHRVMPILQLENPQLAQNVSAMALRLREDEQILSSMVKAQTDVQTLREMPGALRSRALGAFLEECGVCEPEASHIALAEKLVFSHKPSARGSFPGNVVVCRNYDRLEKCEQDLPIEETVLSCPGSWEKNGMRVRLEYAQQPQFRFHCFTVKPQGQIRIRSRRSSDVIHLQGGTKTLKKLFIDRKIPAGLRDRIPVICDDRGILGVFGIGADVDRLTDQLPGVTIFFEKTEKRE